MQIRKWVLGLAMAWTAASGLALAADLRAGAAKRVITPDVVHHKVYMAGFGHNRIATSVHDDLYVRCVALGAGRANLALCEADLIGLFYDDAVKVRQAVLAQMPQTTQVIVASTHTHEGPDTLGLWGSGPLASGIDAKYMNELDGKIASTAIQALRSMKPATLILARSDDAALAHLQDDSRPPYVKDPHLLVMRLATVRGGKPIATLVNWSDHPETLGGKNTQITADYPHWLCQYVEQHNGGMAAFFQGSIGGLLSTLGSDVSLIDPATGKPAADGTWEKAELVGNRIGELATQAIQSAEPVTVDQIVVRQKVFLSPLDNDVFRAASAAGVFKKRHPLYTYGRVDNATDEKHIGDFGRIKYATGHDIQSEVDYIELRSGGKLLAEIATVPGEIYPELVNGGITRYPGADFPDAPFEPVLRDHMVSPYKFVFGLANDELGYIIPKSEWDNQPPWLMNHPTRWYGEVNSAGEETAGNVLRSLMDLLD